MTEVYKFQKLRVYQMALDYVDAFYEQSRFLGLAIRSYLETVACLDLSERHVYFVSEEINPVREGGHQLFIKLQAFRRSLRR